MMKVILKLIWSLPAFVLVLVVQVVKFAFTKDVKEKISSERFKEKFSDEMTELFLSDVFTGLCIISWFEIIYLIFI